MNLVLRFLSALQKISGDLGSELQQLCARANTWASKEHATDGAHASISVTGLTWNGETQTTVGAAGGASALPATPLGFYVMTIPIGGINTDVLVPYYVKA